MKTIINKSFDPFYNLAFEEYLLKKLNTSEDIFYLWRNRKCVILGRNQNPFNEIDFDYAQLNNIDVLRRSSGGGTVYHDEGNINFTFISSNISKRLNNYEFFLKRIIEILNTLGIKAKFIPKTHIYVGEYKVSGNAQTYYKDKMIHHGTLLFDVDLVHLDKVLKKKTNINTFAIPSVRSMVINLKNLLDSPISIESFMDYMIKEIQLENDDFIDLSEEQYKEIDVLSNEKYRTWEWIFGQTPKFVIDKDQYHFEISKCLITKSSHFDDYLLGLKYDQAIISKALEKHEDKEKILKLLFQ